MGLPVEIALKYLTRDVDRHGNVRIYLRRPGQRKIRLHETPGTPGFLDEYRSALAVAAPARVKRPAALSGSLQWLFERYYEMGEFRRLGPGTRRVRKNLLTKLADTIHPDTGKRYGDLPYRPLKPHHIRGWRDERTDTPEAANAIVKAMRQVFDGAIANDLANENPADKVPYFQSGSEGFHTWTVEEVRQFEARHPIGTKARLALGIFLFAGLRRSDAAKIGKQMERGETLNWTEVKGRKRKFKERTLPILPELRRLIDATPSGHLAYLVGEHGGGFTPESLGNWFRKRCNEAGLKHCSAHGLRKAGATIAADNGATAHQLMSIYGWETLKEAERYTRKANMKKLAAGAMHMVVPAVPLSPTLPKVGQKQGGK